MAAVRPQHNHRPSGSNPFADFTQSKPPPPPPKPSKYLKMSAPAPKPQHNDLSDAVRDTVVLRGHSDHPRTRPTRSQTAVSPPSNINLHTSTRRSQSQDSAGMAEKHKNKRTGKNSQHADVIDRLDITSVGPMFHHDGPFDACAPSRNRQRNMAPIHSWSPIADDHLAVSRYGDSAYPSAYAYGAFSNTYTDPPKKKVDAIAEAWGMHEPEPFEEFLAGGGKGDTPTSSIYNGRDSHTRTKKRAKDSRDVKLDDTQNSSVSPSRPRVMTRRTVPPPQPIFVPDPVDMGGEGSPTLEPPKRSKSLMQRIRRMRDSPNVPVGSDDESFSMPNSPTEVNTRPTHRSHNSFLGRFGGASKSQSGSAQGASPEKPEPYVLIDAHNKQLPLPPGQNADAVDSATYSGGNGAALGRKTSLIQKVGRAVRGHK